MRAIIVVSKHLLEKQRVKRKGKGRREVNENRSSGLPPTLEEKKRA